MNDLNFKGWFIAGCAAIVQVPELFDNVVPGGQHIDGPDYAGIFHFRFWYYGQWVDVVVDDRLPVRGEEGDERLLFCSNKQEPNEYWAALLEKAYAKMVGAYENLDGGNTTGMVENCFITLSIILLHRPNKTNTWYIIRGRY